MRLHIGNFNGTYMLNNKIFWDNATTAAYSAALSRLARPGNEDETLNAM